MCGLLKDCVREENGWPWQQQMTQFVRNDEFAYLFALRCLFERSFIQHDALGFPRTFAKINDAPVSNLPVA
jgi:hypothetical protein